MQDVYKNIEDYNPTKNSKVLIVFDDMIADMINNKKLNSIITELFIKGRKLNISIVFITQSYFKAPNDVRLNSTHFFIMKIPNKRELRQFVLNHSSDIDFKESKPIKTEPNEYSDYFLNGLAKIRDSSEPIHFNNLIYHFKSPNISSINFSNFK